MLQKLERKFGKYSITNLTVYLILMTLTVTGLNMFTASSGGLDLRLGEISQRTIANGEYWNIFLYPFRLEFGPGTFFGIRSGGFISLLIFLYIYWIFGNMLESSLGSFRYTLYVLLSMALMVIGTLFLPIRIPSFYLELSLFLACAYLYPNMEILLFFILPVRIKWMAIFFIGYMLVSKVIFAVSYGSPLFLLESVLGFGNFLIFYTREIVSGFRHRTSSIIRTEKFRNDITYRHQCTVCGMTENDDPSMDFRFCVDCKDHEYCMNHLNNHEHI